METPRNVTSKQKHLVEETVAQYVDTRDVVRWTDVANVSTTSDMGKKVKKLEKRIVAVSKYRLFIFAKGTFGSYSLEKDYHLLNLQEIGGANKQAFFKFSVSEKKGSMFVIINTDNLSDLVRVVRESYRRITFGWSEEQLCKETNRDLTPSRLPQDPELGKAHGFGATYRAWANLLKAVPKIMVMNYAEDKFDTEDPNFVLSDVPGIHVKMDLTFDLLTVAHALQSNTFFKSIEMREVEHKDAPLAFARILERNRTVTRVVLTDANAEVPEELGRAIQTNALLCIQILQLNNCKIYSKAVSTLAQGLRVYPFPLTVLSLRQCNIGSGGMSALANALRMNWGMSLGIRDLDISHNPFTLDWAKFFKEIRNKGALKRLNLSNTNLGGFSVLLDLANIDLEFVDLSDNKFDRVLCDHVSHFTEQVRCLNVLRMSNVSLGGEMLMRVLRNLFTNANLVALSVDFSRNPINPKGAQLIASVMKLGTKLVALDLSETGIREKGGIAVLQTVQPSLQCLVLDRVFSEGGKLTDDLLATLGGLMASFSSLHLLSIAGGSGARLGKSIAKLFPYIKSCSAVEMDLSGHHMGDEAFAILCDNLRTNVFLRSLKCDDNSVSVDGYLALKHLLSVNGVITHLEHPLVDLANSKSERLRRMLNEVEQQLHLRSAEVLPTPAVNWAVSPFEFDLKWPTPQLPLTPIPVPDDLAAVAAALKDVSLDVTAGDDAEVAARILARQSSTTEEPVSPRRPLYDESSSSYEVDNSNDGYQAYKDTQNGQIPPEEFEMSDSDGTMNGSSAARSSGPSRHHQKKPSSKFAIKAPTWGAPAQSRSPASPRSTTPRTSSSLQPTASEPLALSPHLTNPRAPQRSSSLAEEGRSSPSARRQASNDKLMRKASDDKLHGRTSSSTSRDKISRSTSSQSKTTVPRSGSSQTNSVLKGQGSQIIVDPIQEALDKLSDLTSDDSDDTEWMKTESK